MLTDEVPPSDPPMTHRAHDRRDHDGATGPTPDGSRPPLPRLQRRFPLHRSPRHRPGSPTTTTKRVDLERQTIDEKRAVSPILRCRSSARRCARSPAMCAGAVADGLLICARRTGPKRQLVPASRCVPSVSCTVGARNRSMTTGVASRRRSFSRVKSHQNIQGGLVTSMPSDQLLCSVRPRGLRGASRRGRRLRRAADRPGHRASSMSRSVVSEAPQPAVPGCDGQVRGPRRMVGLAVVVAS